MKQAMSLLFVAGLLSPAAQANDLPDAPSATRDIVVTMAVTQKVCDTIAQGGVQPPAGSGDCEVTPEKGVESTEIDAKSHFYMDVMISWEHAFGSSDWGKKIFYSGAYRVVDKKTGRRYDVLRFDNEQGLPLDETADSGNRRIHFSDYINDIKAYQTQQKDKDGHYVDDDDDLTARSKFIGEVVDEKDYGRRLHYFVAIPIGWDRTYEKHLGKVEVVFENEIGVGGLAYAGIFQDDGSVTGHTGVNLVRTINSVSFNFAAGDNSFGVTPMEFTNDCSAFRQGLGCEWEAAGTFQYQNDKTGIGASLELAHKTGLSAYGQTRPENVIRMGVSIDPVKTVYGIRKVWKKLKSHAAGTEAP